MSVMRILEEVSEKMLSFTNFMQQWKGPGGFSDRSPKKSGFFFPKKQLQSSKNQMKEP